MPLPRLVATLSLALAASIPLVAHAADCAALLRQHMATDMALAFDPFDQDEHQGWRPLGHAGCSAEAATLIAAYAGKHPHPVLAWHRAQMLADAGQTAEAIAAARQTLRPPGGDDESGFDWNDYANATIAFLQGDKAALQASHDLLAAATSKADINQPNLKAVERLQRCFGQPYDVAYSCPSTP
jgi:hypothetical protein